MGDKLKYRDPKTGQVKTGRIVVKPGRERDAALMRGMAEAAVQAGYERHQEMKKQQR